MLSLAVVARVVAADVLLVRTGAPAELAGVASEGVSGFAGRAGQKFGSFTNKSMHSSNVLFCATFTQNLAFGA